MKNRPETFETWFNRTYLDPDGGADHLPTWFKGDLKLAWEAALASQRERVNQQLRDERK